MVRTRNRPWKATGLALLVLLIPTAAPPGASAAKVVNAKAVINSCGGDQLVITARARPKKRVRGRGSRRRLRRLRRKIRGAKLEAQFNAVALFGGIRHGPWVRADRGGRARHSFDRLSADTWSGFVRFRWRKGGRTTATSFVNSSNGRVGGRRGRSLCSLAVGVPPRDTAAPFAAIFPRDSAWRRPFTAHIVARDDFSGVSATEYRIDGGPLQRGPDIPLNENGSHTVEFRAHDVAGNTSAFRRATLRVDNAAPSAPVVDPARFNPTGDVTPTIRWRRSSDSGSGVDHYIVEARKASNGALVKSRTVRSTGASRQSATLPPLHSDFTLRSYTIRVIAVDKLDFSRASASRRFNVDTRPLYRNSFETTTQCDQFVLVGSSPNPFSCANRRSESVFPGREFGASGDERPTPLSETWTATATRPFNAADGQRVGISLARLIRLVRTADNASFEVSMDGDVVLSGDESSPNAAEAHRVGALWTPTSSGSHTLQINLSLTLEGGPPNTQAGDKLLVDEIFLFLID